jgi:enolase
MRRRSIHWSRPSSAIDVAASQFYSGGCYRLAADGAELETEALIELLAGWCRRYPILSIEDPVAEDDDTGMVSFTAKLGSRIQIIGDDYLVTSAQRVAAAIFPQMTLWLPEDEAAQFRIEFETELARLERA